MNFCADIRRSLGDLYLLNRRLIEAESQLRMALSIFEKDEGQQYTDEAASWMGLGASDAQHKTVDCLQAADVARAKLHELTVKVLPLLAESQQLVFWPPMTVPLQKSLALVAGPCRRPAGDAFFGRLDTQSQRPGPRGHGRTITLARQARDPALAALVDDWVAVRHQLANVTVASGSARAQPARTRRGIDATRAGTRPAVGPGQASADGAQPLARAVVFSQGTS